MNVVLQAPPPPVDSTSDGGGGRDWIELLCAANDIDAALLTGRLEDAMIETRCLKDRGAPGAWLYGGSNPWAPVHVFVRRYQLGDARFVLAELSFEAPSAPGEQTSLGRSTRRPTSLRWATALTLGLVLSVLAISQMARGTGFCQLPILCERQATSP